MMGKRRRRTPLEDQAASRENLRNAVRVYAHLRAAAGQHLDTVGVTLRDGTPAVALIRIDLVPDASADPTLLEERS